MLFRGNIIFDGSVAEQQFKVGAGHKIVVYGLIVCQARLGEGQFGIAQVEI